MSCYKQGAAVWATGLRRICVIQDLVEDDGTMYGVESTDHTHSDTEVRCCDLRSLDRKTVVGRHNLRVVGKIEKLLASLR